MIHIRGQAVSSKSQINIYRFKACLIGMKKTYMICNTFLLFGQIDIALGLSGLTPDKFRQCLLEIYSLRTCRNLYQYVERHKIVKYFGFYEFDIYIFFIHF